jgi:hypothetical protein
MHREPPTVDRKYKESENRRRRRTSRDFLIIEAKRNSSTISKHSSGKVWTGLRACSWYLNQGLGADIRGNSAFPQKEVNTSN